MSKQNREPLLLAAGATTTRSCLLLASKYHGELPARGSARRSSYLLPVAFVRQLPSHEKQALSKSPDASYCSPNGPHLPLYSRPFSVSELRWEFRLVPMHTLFARPKHRPNTIQSSALTSVTSLQMLQRVNTQQSLTCPIPNDARRKWWHSVKESPVCEIWL